MRRTEMGGLTPSWATYLAPLWAWAGRPPFARASPGRWATAGNTPPPPARRPPSSASGAAWSAQATATYIAAARQARSRGAPSGPRGHYSPHGWPTRAGGDGTAHGAREYGGR